jgi:hypothetical protein
LIDHGRSDLRRDIQALRAIAVIAVFGYHLWPKALASAWSPQITRGTRIIAIRDNPAMRPDVVTCVARFGLAANAHCALPASQALGARDALVEAVRLDPGARLIDMTDIYCPAGVCLPLIGHVVVFQDKDHMTATFVRTLVPALSDRIKAALR